MLPEAEALTLLQQPTVGNVQPGQRQMELERALDRATEAEDDHRRVRQAAVGTGGAPRMRFRCDPGLPVEVIGLFVLLPAPQL